MVIFHTMIVRTDTIFQVAKEPVQRFLCFIHTRVLPLLIVLILISSCNTNDKSNDVASRFKSASGIATENNPPVPQEKIIPADPDFIPAMDTFSTHGPRSITRNIFQDKKGNIWFATWQGVIRYDASLNDKAGSKSLFINVTIKEGFPRFHIFSMLEDQTGNLWFGTVGGGVIRYHPVSAGNTDGSAFTNFTTEDGLAGNAVMCMLEDRSGSIWLGTRDGLSRYDGNTFTNFTVRDGLSSNTISSIMQDKTGKLWIGSDGGVDCLASSQMTMPSGKLFTAFTNDQGLNFYRVRSIIEDKKGSIWIGSADGLCKYDPASSGNGKLFSNFKNSTYFIFEDKKGNLWLSDGKPGSPEMTLTKYDGSSFLNIISRKQIFGITEDRNGNIWFGTEYGAWRYDPSSQKSVENSMINFSE
jgi:ligand-binding sensor domain-containing protein